MRAALAVLGFLGRALREFGTRPGQRTCQVPGCSVCGGPSS